MAEETNNEKVAGCLLFLMWIPVAVILRGYTISKLWAWFMVPIFGLRSLGIAGFHWLVARGDSFYLPNAAEVG